MRESANDDDCSGTCLILLQCKLFLIFSGAHDAIDPNPSIESNIQSQICFTESSNQKTSPGEYSLVVC